MRNLIIGFVAGVVFRAFREEKTRVLWGELLDAIDRDLFA